MSELVANCPRCNAKNMTFNLISDVPTVKYDWQQWYEAFCICRACRGSTIFVLSQIASEDEYTLETYSLSQLPHAVNQYMRVVDYISLKDKAAEQPPEHLPENIKAVFSEGASCRAIGCYNAACTMFRLCIDLATKSILPKGADGPNGNIRRNLGLRLPWLFDKKILPEDLRDLATCIKEDGNEGAHEGTLGKEEAGDILDFTFVLLKRIYTEPKRIELASERRIARRKKNE